MPKTVRFEDDFLMSPKNDDVHGVTEQGGAGYAGG